MALWRVGSDPYQEPATEDPLLFWHAPSGPGNSGHMWVVGRGWLVCRGLRAGGRTEPCCYLKIQGAEVRSLPTSTCLPSKYKCCADLYKPIPAPFSDQFNLWVSRALQGPSRPLSPRVATPAPRLLLVPTPVSRAGHCLPPSNVSEVFCFLTLPPLRPSYCSCDGSFPAPGPPRCLGSSDHKQNDMKQQYRLTSPLPPGPALASSISSLKMSPSPPIPWLLNTPTHAFFYNDDDTFQTFKKYTYITSLSVPATRV